VTEIAQIYIGGIINCQGCNLHFPYYIGDLRPKCIIKIPYSKSLSINVLSKQQSSSIIPQAKIITRHSHPYYRLLAYNDFLASTGRINSLNLTVQSPPSTIDSNSAKNIKLINALISHSSIQHLLIEKSRILHPFVNIDFYTDGSFSQHFEPNEFPMGYGWTTSNLSPVNITFNGSLRYFPSSTKAEIMAILTSLIVAPPKSHINIFTDSQAAIDGFYKSVKLSALSPRRYNKLNNNILWTTIHYIIKELELKIKLFKIKAHSNLLYNDIADAEAKVGRLFTIPIEINYQHLPSQRCTIVWDDTIPLDKDIRKNIGSICNFKRMENHLNHENMSTIKKATANNLINWHASSRWFHYKDPAIVGTSLTHTKSVSWKIKISTGHLATLDILNRNFPKLINNNTLCFFCKRHDDHIWNCQEIRSQLSNEFDRLARFLEKLLIDNSDKLQISVHSTIKYSKTFRWTSHHSYDLPPEPTLLIKSYITDDLYSIFKAHFSHRKNLEKHLFIFMNECSSTFKSKFWKQRSLLWKAWKADNNITKNDFKNYRRNVRDCSSVFNNTIPTPSVNPRKRRRNEDDFLYVNPQHDFRNYKNTKDLLMILFSSSNFLHSGPFFDHITNFSGSHSNIIDSRSHIPFYV
jgi:ribonuclease HI